MFTGDDFNFGELIAGDGKHYSHGLLGIFDPIAPIAATALQLLARGEVAQYRRIIDPTVALGREIFRAPTRHYKAGVVFLAWLNGHQSHFSMLGGLQSARDVTALCARVRAGRRVRCVDRSGIGGGADAQLSAGERGRWDVSGDQAPRSPRLSRPDETTRRCSSHAAPRWRALQRIWATRPIPLSAVQFRREFGAPPATWRRSQSKRDHIR